MTNNPQMTSFLDAYKKSHGIYPLKSAFYNTGKVNRQKAAMQLNHAHLTFPTLYVLIPEINALDLYDMLNFRNAEAIWTCAKILSDDTLAQRLSVQQASDEQKYPVLKWMFITGWQEDGLNNQFDYILDIITAVLIKKYKDQGTLPTIVHEIFERSRKGLYIHDLVWNFYQARNPNALKLVAQYLRSNNEQDVKLAREILHFTSETEREVPGNPNNQYVAYLSWFQENQPYFYFSGESMQYSSEPEAFKVNLEAKYLSKKTSPDSLNNQLNPFEQEKIGQFQQIPSHDRKLLANYSCRYHDQNPQQWNQWMRYDIHQQLKTVKSQEAEHYD